MIDEKFEYILNNSDVQRHLIKHLQSRYEELQSQIDHYYSLDTEEQKLYDITEINLEVSDITHRVNAIYNTAQDNPSDPTIYMDRLYNKLNIKHLNDEFILLKSFIIQYIDTTLPECDTLDNDIKWSLNILDMYDPEVFYSYYTYVICCRPTRRVLKYELINRFGCFEKHVKEIMEQLDKYQKDNTFKKELEILNLRKKQNFPRRYNIFGKALEVFKYNDLDNYNKKFEFVDYR